MITKEENKNTFLVTEIKSFWYKILRTSSAAIRLATCLVRAEPFA